MSDWFKPPSNNGRDFFDASLVFAAMVVVSFLLMLAMSGCGAVGTPEIKYVEKVVTVPVTARCAKVPPPTLSPIGAPIVCLTSMVCLTTIDAATVTDNVSRLKSWVAETWTLCAPEVK